MLTLSWSDGNTLLPVNSCLLASAKDTNIIGPVKDFDNRTLAGKRRELAHTKAPEAMMTLSRGRMKTSGHWANCSFSLLMKWQILALTVPSASFGMLAGKPSGDFET